MGALKKNPLEAPGHSNRYAVQLNFLSFHGGFFPSNISLYKIGECSLRILPGLINVNSSRRYLKRLFNLPVLPAPDFSEKPEPVLCLRRVNLKKSELRKRERGVQLAIPKS